MKLSRFAKVFLVLNMEDYFHLGVKALIQNAQKELLLLRRRSLVWDLPGGRIQKGETLEEALAREVYEETGLNIISAPQPVFMFLS